MSFIINGVDSVGSSLQNVFGSFSNDIGSAINGILVTLQKAINDITNAVSSFFGTVGNIFAEIYNALNDFVKSASSVLSNIANTFENVFGDIVNIFKNAPKEISDGLNFIIKEVEIGINYIKGVLTGVYDDFIFTITSFGEDIVYAMSYAFAWIRYEFQFMLYYISSHFRNLVGGYIFGLMATDVINMKFTGFADTLKMLAFTFIKYSISDILMQSIIGFYSKTKSITKPTPPSLPSFSGVKL